MALSCAAGTAGAVNFPAPMAAAAGMTLVSVMNAAPAEAQDKPRVLWIDSDEYSGLSYTQSFTTDSANGSTLDVHFENLYADSTALNVNLTWTPIDGSQPESKDYTVETVPNHKITVTVPKKMGTYKLYVTPLNDGERMHFFVNSRQY